VHPTTGGIAQTNISTRGFNNAFSGALLMLQDYRFAGVPSLRVNVPLLLTGVSEDIDRMEVLLGPASALYGPNSANGVLHVITKSPFTSAGTTLTVDAGERSILRGAIRHATALSPRFGFKVSGEYLTGKDWEFDDPAEPGPPTPANPSRPTTYGAAAPPGREGETARRDFDVTKMAGEARIDFRPTPNLDLVTTYGYSKIDNALELTGTNGTAQARNWTYQSIQQRVNWGRLFVQGFVNLSDAGNKDSTDLRGTFLLRNGVPIVDNSRVFAVQAQHGADLFDGRESLVYGVDYIFTNPRTGRTINGRNEDNDDVREIGAYLQSTTHLSRRFDLIGALRVDNHDLLDETFFSPRVALMFMPSETQSLRATYNRAFSTPSNFSFFLDLPQASITLVPGPNPIGFQVRGLGVPTSGFTFRRDCATGAGGLCMRSPFPIVGPTGAITGAPNSVVDANAAQYYRTLVGGNQTAFVNALIAAGVTPANAPTVFQALFGANTAPITTRLRVLRPPRAPGDNPFPVEIQGSEVLDLEPLKATTTDAFEIGYKGILGAWGRLAVDVWYQKRKNFTTPAQNVTPNSFMDPATLGGVIAGVLTAQAGAGRVPAAAVGPLATAFTTTLASVPVGTVVPEHALAQSPDVFFSYRNIAETINLTGTDLGLDLLLSDRVTLIGTYSWISDVRFPKIATGGDTLTLNSPDNKASLTARYEDEARAFGVELRGRYQNTYPVNSGVYVGTVPVNAFVDASVRWKLPVAGQDITLAVSGTNLLDNKRITFIGTPEIGRLIMTRLQYKF
jgi:iron complex outermembrane receptor protein